MVIRKFNECKKCVHVKVCGFIKQYEKTMSDIEEVEIIDGFNVDVYCEHYLPKP